MKKITHFKGVNEKVNFKVIKARNGIENILNNERGDGIITGLLFTALLVIAVLAMKASIDGGFASLGEWFQTTIVTKVKTALN